MLETGPRKRRRFRGPRYPTRNSILKSTTSRRSPPVFDRSLACGWDSRRAGNVSSPVFRSNTDQKIFPSSIEGARGERGARSSPSAINHGAEDREPALPARRYTASKTIAGGVRRGFSSIEPQSLKCGRGVSPASLFLREGWPARAFRSFQGCRVGMTRVEAKQQ